MSPFDEVKAKILVLTNSNESAAFMRRIVERTGLATLAQVTYATFNNPHGFECNVALAYLEPDGDVDLYIQEVNTLKVARQIPTVFAVAAEAVAPLLSDRTAELQVDEVVLLPVDPVILGKNIMTYIVATKIRDEREETSVNYVSDFYSFGELLVHHEVINPAQLKKALEYQSGSSMRLGDTLVLLGYISEEQKLKFLASQLGVELASAKMYAAADLNTVALIPEHIAKMFECIALKKEGDALTVAMVDVLNLQQLDTLRDITNLTIIPVLGAKEDIQTSRERYYQDIASQQDASELMADLGEDVEFVREESEDISVEEAAAAGAELGIIKLVNMIIINAVRDKASDIHIEPMEKELVVRYRVDGELRRSMSPPRKSHQPIITRIKILSNLDIAERRLPQDGRMVIKMGRREIDIRVSILPSIFGEKAVLRILDKEAFEKSVANLGFDDRDLEVFRRNITKPYGMIIVTGPTGSGKSTTLYSAVQTIKSVTRNIITVEDPVEFHMEGITQVQVNNKIHLTFSSALRSILRQDPDVVLIGEIRDNETADIAIKMAMTGHLVFSTLHTNDAASSIARFVDIGIPPLLLGSSLNLIVAQRLVRRICPKCRVQYRPDPELLDQLNLNTREKYHFFQGEGCVNCNGTGYSGRTGLFEMLHVSREMKTLILRNASSREIHELAVKEGMRTLREAGIQKALNGETTIEQVIAVTTEI